ncbi:MAG: hypothetical protein PHV68_06320 [Candidatus Gastranaerophilales bacterium]|nr:hypothetical protein [Candidatus Gastranaerophilales bacterium]
MVEENGNGNNKKESKSKQLLEMQENLMEKLDQAMVCTAERIDKTADKMKDTAKFFRETNSEKLKSESGELIKKYPKHILAGVAIIGFLLGKLLSR